MLAASAVLNVVLLAVLLAVSAEKLRTPPPSATPSSALLSGSPPPAMQRFDIYPGPDLNTEFEEARKTESKRGHRNKPPPPPVPPRAPPEPDIQKGHENPCGFGTTGAEKCRDKGQDTSACTRYLECSTTPSMRKAVYNVFSVRHTHHIPKELAGGLAQHELLVPIRKPLLPPSKQNREDLHLAWKPAPWPSRINLHNFDWSSIPNGLAFERCGREFETNEAARKQHMYCKYFTHEYLVYGEGAVPPRPLGSQYYGGNTVTHQTMPTHYIYDRPDVRLVLDLGASSAPRCLDPATASPDRDDRNERVNGRVTAAPALCGPK